MRFFYSKQNKNIFIIGKFYWVEPLLILCWHFGCRNYVRDRTKTKTIKYNTLICSKFNTNKIVPCFIWSKAIWDIRQSIRFYDKTENDSFKWVFYWYLIHRTLSQFTNILIKYLLSFLSWNIVCCVSWIWFELMLHQYNITCSNVYHLPLFSLSLISLFARMCSLFYSNKFCIFFVHRIWQFCWNR